MSHTPGPWKVSRALWDADTGDVAYIFEGRKHARASDAWLINAAPEMLAILEELRESSTCCGTYDLLDETTWASPDLADRIESAIRKARGEE